MSNPAPIFSNPAILSTLVKHWHGDDGESPVTHFSTGRYLSPGEIMAFLLAAHADPFRGCATLLACSLLTGIPPEDLRHADWSEIDTQNGTLITFSVLRGYFQCHVLTKPACLLLDRWFKRRIDNTVFQLYMEPIELDALEDTLAALGHLAGIDNLTFDDLLRSHKYIALGAALANG